MKTEKDLSQRIINTRGAVAQNSELHLPGGIWVDYGNGRTVFARTPADAIFVKNHAGFMKKGGELL